MKWIGQHIVDLAARFRGDIKIGVSSEENLSIGIGYYSGTQTLENVTFTTTASSSATSAGAFYFNVDGTDRFIIDDFGASALGAVAALRAKSSLGGALGGGLLQLMSNDGAAMGNNEPLGHIEFYGLEASSVLTRGAKIICKTTEAWSTTANGANLQFYTTSGDYAEGLALQLTSAKEALFYGKVTVTSAGIYITNTTTSSALQGGYLQLSCNDDALMDDDHRLGVIEFAGNAGSASGSVGARIQAIVRDAWDEDNNDADLEFYTTDGTTQSKVLTLDADKLATFAGAVTVTGAITGNLTGNASGTAATVTGGTQAAITTCANLVTVGTITTGVWNGTTITKANGGTGLHGETDGKIVIADGSGVPSLLDVGSSTGITILGTVATGVWQGTTIKTAYIGDDQVTEDKLADTLLAEIDANTAKVTNVTTNLTATTHASQITINSSDGTNVIVAEASGSIAGVMSVTHHDKLDAIEASATADQSKSDIDGLAITTVGTVDTGVWNGTKVTDIYTNSSGKRFGNTIKILPSDFMINNDAAVPLSFKDDSNSGVHVNDADNEAIAFVTIPEGMKATLVDVYATHNRVLKVWEVDVNASFDFSGTTKGTGSCNTQLDIDDVDATETNYLAIQIALTNTAQRIWGGVVTIAPQ